MAAVIDLTDISSDEEDSKANVLVSALQGGGAVKKFTAAAGTNGGTVSSSRNASGLENRQAHPQTLLSGSMKVKSAGLRRGRTVKIENTYREEVSSSPRVSTWGEPLPPEPPSHSLVDHGPGGRGTQSASGPSQAPNGNRVDDDPTTERRTAVETGTVSLPSSPTPNPVSTDSSGVCRQFWRAGDYEAQQTGPKPVRGAMDHVRVHPKFLHSNATSHKWALGAVAELVDNAVDEIQNGATFVSVDMIINPRDGAPALLVQDDGGGMSPDCMRQCMSLGYSGKNTNTTIGQYGNGFKTSTMRLGADVIVFSRSSRDSIVTQSIGLLSFTFLRKTGQEDVVVPMIDYEASRAELCSGKSPRKIVRTTVEDWKSNLASVVQWSPYASESELLKQFNDLGWHGTKVIIYNLWFNDDGVLELDFSTDAQDIQLRGGVKQDKKKPVPQQLAHEHIANRYHHSLRVYASILYLQMPVGFQIILRGKPVEHHSIASDLKFPEQIIYKPQIGNSRDPAKDAAVMTVIGFTKEAPLINVHGFNVYHKNRLIMPFWKVWQDNSSRGRGVVGVLEANFVEPAHDKQDFERTAVLLRLETRLKHMTVEYWNLHCHLIGYHSHTKAGKARKQAAASSNYPSPVASIPPADDLPSTHGTLQQDELVGSESTAPGGSRSSGHRSHVKMEPVDGSLNPSRRPGSADNDSEALRLKRQKMAGTGQANPATLRDAGGTSDSALVVSPTGSEAVIDDLVLENSQLRSKCNEYEQDLKRLESRIVELEKELREALTRDVSRQDLQENGLQKRTNL